MVRHRERHVIARLEHEQRGVNPRFVATNLDGDPVALYVQLCCARGEAENRIKEAQHDLICAALVRNTHRVRILLASQHPLKHVFITAARALAPWIPIVLSPAR